MPEAVQRVLVITAHPDDVDFGAAGTVATWTDLGIEVSYCIVTDGDAGGFDPAVPRSRIGGIRRDEQTKAAAEVGVSDLTFLGYPDGRVQPTLELRRDISRVIRRVKPDRVLSQSPVRDFKRIYGSHPDHLATGEATMCAVYPDARNPFTFTELIDEGHEAHAVGELWIMGGPEPTHWIDTTATIDRKMAALRCHASQHQHPDGMEARVREWNRANAAAGGLADGAYAEMFMVVETL